MEEMYVKSSDIKAVLDKGFRVWSAMVGRVGWVVKVDDIFCYINFPHRKMGVTQFDSGDQAEMVWDANQDCYVIRHPEHVWESFVAKKG